MPPIYTNTQSIYKRTVNFNNPHPIRSDLSLGISLIPTTPQDTNGLFHYIGTNEGTVAFVNPVTSNAITATGRPGTVTVSNFFDRSTSNQYLFWPGSVGDRPRIEIVLPKPFQMSHFAFKNPNDPTTNDQHRIVAWNSPNTYLTPNFSTVLTSTALSDNAWNLLVCDSLAFYSNWAIEQHKATNDDLFFRGSEIEFYGQY